MFHLDIQHIRYFLTVAKYQSFTKAAEKLFITQPILTRCVKNLEEELGVPLILRSTKSFTLTDAGQTLVQYGTELIQQHQDIYRRIHDIDKSPTGEIHISSPGVLMDMYFPKLLTQYRRQYPGVHINIRENGSLPVVQDILDGEADIGLVMLPLENSAKLEFFPFVQDEVHVLVHRDHPFTRKSHIHISQLKDIDIITYNQSATLYHIFLRMCDEHGFSPTIVYQSMMPNFIFDTIASGSCVGVLPAPVRQQFNRNDLVSVPLRPHFPWKIAMITKKGRYVSNATSSFLSFAQEYLSRLHQ